MLSLEAALEQIVAPTSQVLGQVIREDLVVDTPIPDNDPRGLVSKIHIDPSGTLQSIRVKVRIIHTWIGDLRVVLSSPQGDQVVLHDRTGTSEKQLITTYSSDSFDPLASLVGKQGRGDWSLHVSDHSMQDIGKLVKWTLQLEYTTHEAKL